MTQVEESTAVWVGEFIAAARKNFPKHTCRPLIAGVSKTEAVRLLTLAGMKFTCTNFRGNRAITIEGDARDEGTKARRDAV